MVSEAKRTREGVIRLKKNTVLTIRQGCFTCYRHMHEGCNTTNPDDSPHDVMAIQTNPQTGERFRCGCCCGDYVEGVKEQVIFT